MGLLQLVPCCALAVALVTSLLAVNGQDSNPSDPDGMMLAFTSNLQSTLETTKAPGDKILNGRSRFPIKPLNRIEPGKPWRKEEVCRPPRSTTYTIGNSVSDLAVLENCTVIEGNLQIVWMVNQATKYNYTNMALPNLYEITGYLLMFRVYGLESIGQLFPNLRVIRVWEAFFDKGMILFEMQDLRSLSMPNLTYIGGSIVAFLNPELCYLKRINWTQILSDDHTISELGNERFDTCQLQENCQKCKGKSDFCWDMDTCQNSCSCDRVHRINGCDPRGVCCHDECLGGCAGGTAYDCYVCKHVFYNKTCLPRCPMQSESGEKLYEFQKRRCVTAQECMQYHSVNKMHDGKCVRECPSGFTDHPNILESAHRYNASVHICIPCDPCEKVCNGGSFQSISGTNVLKDCTIINSQLEIALNFKGNLTQLEENLGSITVVKDYVKIVRSNFLVNLSFLKKLHTIGGQKLDKTYALYVMGNDNLESIWDFSTHPNLTILNGSILFQQNARLCYSHLKTLLNTTKFLGTYEVVNTKGTSIRKNISAATHNEYDVSEQNNGHMGNCFNNSLFLDIRAGPYDFMVEYNFSAFETTDTRTIISYVLFYREVAENETVTYASSHDVCNTSIATWETHEEELDQRDPDKKFYKDFIIDLKAYTLYAFYVQTYTTKAVGLDGARSKIIYFRTQPSIPTSPLTLSVSPIITDSERDRNFGVEVKWKPPKDPNGIIDKYIIFYKRKPWNVEPIDRQDFCSRDVTPAEPAIETTTLHVPRAAVENGSFECSCEQSKEPLSEHEKTSADAVDLRFMLENTIQNAIIQKNPVKLSNSTSKPKQPTRSKRQLSGAFPSTIASTEAPVLLTASPISEGPSMVSVGHNTTSALIFDLEPYSEYLIEVIACQANDEQNYVAPCSKAAVMTGMTRPDPTLDVINSSTFRVTVLENGGELSEALNFTWQIPEKTNGPILTYHIQYSKTGSNTSTTLCVQPRLFRNNNSSHIWYFKSILSYGDQYQFKVGMRTVGNRKLDANHWTEPVIVDLPPPVEVDSPSDYVYILIGLLVCVILAVVIGTYVFYKKKKSAHDIPASTLYNSMNPDYFNTSDVYVPDEWEVDRSKIKSGRQLGQGSFGMVYEGTATDLHYMVDEKPEKRKIPVPVAIKTVNEGASIKERIDFLNEASTMKAFNCQHIVKLLGVVSQGQPVLVIMELMAQGDLKNYLRMHRPEEPDNDGRRPPTLKEIFQMAAEIADGMAYLSTKKYVHRDLAARNCMVSADMTVKIGDFGMTRDIYETDYYRKGGKGLLPVRWMSPESLKDGVFTSMSDVWSYGVVLWEMATLAAQPYQGFSNEQVLKYVVDGNIMEMPSACPARLYDMMKKCWEYYPKNRFTFGEILEMLQGDLKKSFFSVSWYYTHKDDSSTDPDSEIAAVDLDDEDENLAVRQPLNPDSRENSLSSERGGTNTGKKGVPHGYQNGNHAVCNGIGASTPDFTEHSRLNGHPSHSDSDSGSISCGECVTQAAVNITDSIKRKPSSSNMSYNTEPPPSYKMVVGSGSAGGAGDGIWSTDGSKGSSKGSSCNGSANGHMHYSLTTSC